MTTHIFESRMKHLPEHLATYKHDHRPALGIWCPGEYLCFCRRCELGFIGDKRSGICADCAYAGQPKENHEQEG